VFIKKTVQGGGQRRRGVEVSPEESNSAQEICLISPGTPKSCRGERGTNMVVPRTQRKERNLLEVSQEEHKPALGE